MLGAVILDVVETQELDIPLATTVAFDVPVAVMKQCQVSILAEARFPVLVVAELAPDVRSLSARQQIELADRLFLIAPRASLAIGQRCRQVRRGTRPRLEHARVVPPPRRAVEAVLATAKVASLT